MELRDRTISQEMMANSPGSSQGGSKKRRTCGDSDTGSETEDGCLNKEEICQKYDKLKTKIMPFSVKSITCSTTADVSGYQRKHMIA